MEKMKAKYKDILELIEENYKDVDNIESIANKIVNTKGLKVVNDFITDFLPTIDTVDYIDLNIFSEKTQEYIKVKTKYVKTLIEYLRGFIC